MKTMQELASTDTTSTVVRGSSGTYYALEPIKWLKEISDAAQKRFFFSQFVYQTTAPKGTKDVVIPKRKWYLKSSDWESSSGEGVAVAFTDLNNLDGVTITPLDKNAGVSIANRALRVNAIDLIKAAKDELIYRAGDLVDVHVATTIGNATAATSSAAGAQTIYGGDARSDAELASGDTITTDMIADGKTKLMSTICKYWTPSSPAAEAVSSATKNPWVSVPGEPFVLFIAPEQENVFMKDSQFINASEYGSDQIIHNGEIGDYLGIKIITTANTESATTSDDSPDGTGNPGANMHRCILMKARKAAALVYGQKPKLHVFSYPSELEQRLVLEQAYAAGVVHDDAIVFIDVADA